MRVVFFHPDLGIGGAERLIVDAAIGLQQRGHTVAIYTSHYDATRAFEDIQTEKVPVRVYGRLPHFPAIGFYILIAICRQLLLTLAYLFRLHVTKSEPPADVLFVDQLPACIPLLRLLTRSRVLYYGHFPDALLTPRDTFLKKCYRVPFDYLEEWTTRQAHRFLVNSQFTARTYMSLFTSMQDWPQVLYPAINLQNYANAIDTAHLDLQPLLKLKPFLLSINRFEMKKRLSLAVNVFAKLKKYHDFVGLQLVLAGGYDTRLLDNVRTKASLESLATSHKLTYHTLDGREKVPEKVDILFLPNFTSTQRNYLLQKARLLLYTPSNEHFGIVPVEAMYAKLPVLAPDDGGPRETVLEGRTGYLCDDEDAFVNRAHLLLSRPDLRDTFADAGREWVEKQFSLDAFTKTLEHILKEMVTEERAPSLVTHEKRAKQAKKRLD